MEPLPLVSVIALCYNHEKYVLAALESVAAQSYPHIELFIVDDASTDQSRRHIERFVSRSQSFPVHTIFLPENQGNCKAFNQAFFQTKGDFIIDLATDDRLLPECIEEQVRAFGSLDQKYGVVFSNVAFINASGRHIGVHYKEPQKVPSGDLYQRLLRPGGFISPPGMIVRRQVLAQLGGYDETLAYEDYDFWVRSSRDYHYFFLPKVLVEKRVLKNSLGSRFYARKDSAMLESTLRVCQKAQKLNRTAAEQSALLCSVRYHLRQSIFTENFTVARAYVQLRRKLGQTQLQDYFWELLSRLRLPLFFPYRCYLRILGKN